MIVADAGPIIAYARMGRLDLLRRVVGELVIPDAVFQELTGQGHERPGAAEVTNAKWIRRHAVSDQAAVDRLPRVLHRGEREAIVLAQELGAQLLIDEQRGRNMAAARGLEVVGSLRILADAKRLGFIDRTKPLLDAILAAGYWIDEGLIRAFLDDQGEDQT
jgi:uncharacterized protein